jgi:hypothetical protein
LLPIRIGAANAAGALAVGACAAYGYAYDYPSSETAQAAAIGKCGGSCKKVVTTDKGCVALAVDGHKPCGPNGFANGPRLGAAQNTALKHCYKHLALTAISPFCRRRSRPRSRNPCRRHRG